ncbi:LmeA family phospholipid-binding protein [uncultured Microbacterium sp.]|uniref:LmeA family phospholipid-binding protein n=1 Tax=uncultured Microbacterium sp. TaxID=191216 RepID=UPI00262BF952|nr:LmeA family phospholipid-binding protein [uncultured Microbacterium sp.]
MSDENPTLPYPDTSVEHPTLVIPDGDAVASAPRRRRRWPWVLLIVVIVIAALAVAAELLARSILPGIVRGVVIDQLDLPADQQVDVATSGLLLPQLLGGTLDELHLSTPAVTIGGITGAADVTATDVAIDGSGLGAADGTVRITEEELTTLVSAADIPIDAVTFAAPEATASGSFAVFGVPVLVELTVTPGADAGDLLLTPVKLEIAGLELNAAQLAERFGAVAGSLTEPQRICIADQLPAGVTVTDLTIEGDAAVIDLVVDGAIITDANLRQNGECS